MKRHLVWVVLAASCVRSNWVPVQLQLAYEESATPVVAYEVPSVSFGANEVSSAPVVAPCRVRVATVTDDRPGLSRNDLGHVGGARVLAEHIPEWAHAGLDTVGAKAAAPVAAHAEGVPTDVIIDASIRRLYIRALKLDLVAVVAVDVRYTRRDGTIFQRNYRGTAHRVNLAATHSEIQFVLNRALEKAVLQIAVELPGVCASGAHTGQAG